MIRLFTVFTLLFLLSTNSFSSEHYTGSQASKRLPGSSELWFKTGEVHPHFIKLDQKLAMTEQEALIWLKAQFPTLKELQFELLRTNTNAAGITSSSYSILRNDVRFEFLRITLHGANGLVRSISGNILANFDVVNAVTIIESEALILALTEIGAAQYKWQIAEEEQWLKDETGDNNASFYPKAELVIIASDLDYKKSELRYAHRFDIYANQPYSREEIYVDAQSGDVIFRHDLLREADTVGTAHTGYSGIRQITTDYQFITNDFRLREAGRGNGINTWNLKTSTNFSNRTDFIDDDNTWKDMLNQDEYGTDAHWGAEMTYDYFFSSFGRNSIDDNGFQLNSYVHYGEAFNNAFWDGQRMIFGDGNGSPYTTVDITGHEITHGLTDFTADLIYMNEMGALNESFSDIFGNCIEYFGKPASFSWRIGEDRGSFIRDMQNPNVRYNPDTYQGSFWYAGTGDNGGVHINSGVQNFWFYLLCEGGNGINDIGKSYTVNGIGIQNAASIAYENLNSYLSPLSDYEEARFYSIQAAIDLFGSCSPQHAATVNAWYAVGLGDEFVGKAVASFSADRLEFCNPPFKVDFQNKSLNGVSYNWDFGDGGSSTDESPSHVYSSSGEFTVTLSVDGDGCGLDELIEEKFIKVVHPETPTAANVLVNKGSQALLKAQSAGNAMLHWYKDKTGSEILHMGNQFTTGPLYKDTVFYVRSVVPGIESEIGEDLQKGLASGQYSSSDLGLVFDMYQNAEIQSVTVNASTAGDRTFLIEDKYGNKVYEEIFSLSAGIQEVGLNASLPIGNGYTISIAGTNRNLWRSQDASYPFEIPGLCTIVENTLGANTIYPYFYDWKLKEEDCQSDNKEISVGIQDTPNGKRRTYSFYAETATNGGYNYKVRFEFLSETTINFGLYSISGQRITDLTPPPYDEGVTVIDLNKMLDLNSNAGGVYFLTITGEEIEKSERLIISNKGN
ncbi:MAG: M4 family metallopeptidase [Vicingaceae bacterium]